MELKLNDYSDVYYSAMGGNRRIGQVSRFENDTKQAFDRGYLIVEDLILPEQYEVKINTVLRVEDAVPADVKKKLDESRMPIDSIITEAWVALWHDLAIKKSRELKKFGVGALMYRPVGDGSATYVVDAMRKRGSECRLAWRGFSLDRWVDHTFQAGVWYRSKDIARLCEYGPSEELFGSFKPDWQKSWRDLVEMGAVPTGMVAGVEHAHV